MPVPGIGQEVNVLFRGNRRVSAPGVSRCPLDPSQQELPLGGANISA